MSDHRIHWQPGVEEIVAREKADAWDEGALRIADLLGCGFDSDHLARLNPYLADPEEKP